MSPQVPEDQQLFRALKTLLEDLRAELREDERARLRLQQQYASDKAAWDVEWAVLRGRLQQVPAAGGGAQAPAATLQEQEGSEETGHRLLPLLKPPASPRHLPPPCSLSHVWKTVSVFEVAFAFSLHVEQGCVLPHQRASGMKWGSEYAPREFRQEPRKSRS